MASLQLERGDVLAWARGPGRLVTIPEGFEALPIRQRIELLLAALFAAFPDVRGAQEGNYTRLAPRLTDARTPGSPPAPGSAAVGSPDRRIRVE